MMKKADIRQRIPLKELLFSASRSSGPGGQNVNKVSSRIELRFKLSESAFLTDDEKKRLLEKLKNRINSDGELIIVCQTERSQLRNKEKALERFYNLLEKSLELKPPRIPTKPSKASKIERLDSKMKRSGLKKTRGKVKGSSEDS